MRTRAFITLLIILTLFPKVLACDIQPFEPKEVEYTNGINGDCYTKRIPSGVSTYDITAAGYTEFYLNKVDDEPLFTLPEWFWFPNILCISDSENIQHIAHVENLDYREGFDKSNIDNKAWLGFYIDNQLVKSYSPIELIKSESNAGLFTGCDFYYLGWNFGFVFDESRNQYVYQVMTGDEHVINFNPLTGEILDLPQTLDVQLMDAIKTNNVVEVRNLLSQGANPNSGNANDGTPLHVAASLGSIEMIEELLDASAEFDYKETTDWESLLGSVPHHPLYIAARNGHKDAVIFLLERGADVNAQGFIDYGNPHTYAIQATNRQDIIQILLEAGARKF
jgi:hypothetical protein